MVEEDKDTEEVLWMDPDAVVEEAAESLTVEEPAEEVEALLLQTASPASLTFALSIISPHS